MSDSPIVYEDRLLAFLDILGFSERLLRSGKDQKLVVKFKQMVPIGTESFRGISIR